MAASTAIRPTKPRAVRILLGQRIAKATSTSKKIPIRVVHRYHSLRFPFGFPQPDAGTSAVFFEKDASGFFKRGQYFLNCVSSATELTFH